MTASKRGLATIVPAAIAAWNAAMSAADPVTVSIEFAAMASVVIPSSATISEADTEVSFTIIASALTVAPAGVTRPTRSAIAVSATATVIRPVSALRIPVSFVAEIGAEISRVAVAADTLAVTKASNTSSPSP